MSTSNEKTSNDSRLVVSIINYLGDKLRSDDLNQDSKESLEIAIQCLESAFNVSSSDTHLLLSKTLQEIFNEVAEKEPAKDGEASYRDKEEAERLKNEGNDLMKQEKYEDALKNYTKAIQLDCKNPVYFCNRAAAYSKLNNHVFALEDCQRAIEIDPSYSKAYGRMGLAYASLNDHAKAKEFYKKAIELDPNNESFRNNLKIAEEKAIEMQRENPLGSLLSNMNLESIMQNPAIMNFAQRMMSNEGGAANVFSQMMGTFGGPPSGNAPASEPAGFGNASTTENSSSNPQSEELPDLTPFFRAGQQFVEQMQSTNPELIESLRSQFNNMNGSNRNNQE